MSSLTHAIGGIFQPLLKLVAGLLAWFFSIIPNYPIDVALLTIVIMAILTPLTVKSTKNMAAMQALGPEMKKLQQKYKGPENRVVLNEEMMKLYKEHKVNPASGCLPMLLQMPAFLILYDVIRGITNTVAKGAPIPGGGTCHPLPGATVCAVPRYINSDTAMYKHIVAASGQLNSFGINFAEKLLSHHGSIWAAIPYAILVLGSVGLQYLQMSRLNARNPQAAQANPQAAMMQRYMPLIFGLIYLNVAALLNVYFIISSSIRIGTQEILFRRGIVPGPPQPGDSKPAAAKGPKVDRTEREIPKAKPSSSSKGGSSTKAGGSGKAGTSGGTASGRKPSTTRARDLNGSEKAGSENGSGAKANGTNGSSPARSGSAGSKAGGSSKERSPSGNGSTSAASAASGTSDDDDSASAKEHPRSKAKRERKAR